MGRPDTRERRAPALRIAECLDHRHLDVIAFGAVVRAVATVAEIGAGSLEEFLGERFAPWVVFTLGLLFVAVSFERVMGPTVGP